MSLHIVEGKRFKRGEIVEVSYQDRWYLATYRECACNSESYDDYIHHALPSDYTVGRSWFRSSQIRSIAPQPLGTLDACRDRVELLNQGLDFVIAVLNNDAPPPALRDAAVLAVQAAKLKLGGES